MDPNEAKNLKKQDPDFPELTKRRDFDRGLLIKEAMEDGMTREQAERHADEHMTGRAVLEGKTEGEATKDLREHGIENKDL